MLRQHEAALLLNESIRPAAAWGFLALIVPGSPPAQGGMLTHCSWCCPSTGAPIFCWWILHSLIPQKKLIPFSTNYPLIAISREKKAFQWKSLQLSSLKYCSSLCSLIPITDRNTRNKQECKAAQDLVGMTAVPFHLLWPIGEVTTARYLLIIIRTLSILKYKPAFSQCL